MLCPVSSRMLPDNLLMQLFPVPQPRRINDYSNFNLYLARANKLLVVTGAGISAESGIKQYKGPDGLWRNLKPKDLATFGVFRTSPAIVWEFYHHQRAIAFNAKPNKAHIALVKLEEKWGQKEDSTFTLITTNIDGLHQKAGSKNVIELHGSLSKVRCTVCKAVEVNTDHPITPAFKGREGPEVTRMPHLIRDELPKCIHCKQLLRPHVTWSAETLDLDVLKKAKTAADAADMCLLVGLPSLIFPAVTFPRTVADKGRIVAEFNINEEPARTNYRFHFPGPCTATLPKVLGFDESDLYDPNADDSDEWTTISDSSESS